MHPGDMLQQHAHDLGDVGDLDHVLGGDLLLDEVGHRRVDEGRAQRGRLDAVVAELLVHRLGEADDRRLGRAVDRQPRLAGLARDRRRVDDERAAVLGARGAQQVDALAVEEDRRAQVDAELQVDLLGRQLADRRADADAGVVDQHVEAPEALAVGAHDLLHDRLVGQVAADGS